MGDRLLLSSPTSIADYQRGGEGADTIVGGGGDLIRGGPGSDLIYLSSWPHRAASDQPWSVDPAIPEGPVRIADFTVGEDHLAISSGYSGDDPVADGWMRIESDGEGGSKLIWLGPPGGTSPGVTFAILERVDPSQLTWANIAGSGSGPVVGIRAVAWGSEGNPNQFIVERLGGVNTPLTVEWSVTGVGRHPVDGADFFGALPGGTITFEPGVSWQYLNVPTHKDGDAERDEEFVVSLAYPSGGAQVASYAAPGWILNDDGALPPEPNPGVALYASSGGDTLSGGAGDDTLYAGAGPDVLAGGRGQDRFVWAHAPTAWAAVTDFSVGADSLDLSGILRDIGYSGSNPVVDGYIRLAGDFTSTNVLLDRDGPGAAAAETLIRLEGAYVSTWAQLTNNLPVISLDPTTVSHPEGDSGPTSFEFTVTRSGPSDERAFANWSLSYGSGPRLSSSDFVYSQRTSDIIFFEPGEVTKTIVVSVAGEKVVEADETFRISISTGSTARLGANSATGVILNDDVAPPPQIGFMTQLLNRSEGNAGSTPLSFTVTRSGSTTDVSTVAWTVTGSGSDPADGLDFAGGLLPSGTLTFAPGETSKNLVVEFAGDTAYEPTERFVITLSGPSGAVLKANATTATGEIANDDAAPPPPPPSTSGGGQVYTSPGPNSTVMGGAGDDTINASQGADRLTGGAGADVFRWAKEPWSPASVTDFVVGTDRIDLSALFSAAGYAGSDPVADKYVSLLTDSSGTKIMFDRDGTASGQQWANYIINLPGVKAPITWAQLTTGGASGGGSTTPAPALPEVGLSTTTLALAEGNSGTTAFSYTVTRTGSATGASSVNWSVTGSGSSPASGSDFASGVLPSGTLTFEPGETSKTIVVGVAGDTTVESSQGFTLTLSGVSGATLGTSTAMGTITNDDQAAAPPATSGQVYTSPGPGSTVTAGVGNDTLNASQGADRLTGGAGADVFRWAKEPWSPATVTDFVVGTDKIDLSALFSAAGYTGLDPVADKYISLLSDASGTKILFDRDGVAAGQQWPNYVINLQGVTQQVTWGQLSGGSDGSGGGTTTAPPSSGGSQIAFTTLSKTVAEGASGAAAFSYTVTRTGDTNGTASVSWSVSGSGSDPASGADFVGGILPSGTLTFAAGETSKTLTVNVAGDTTVEANEGFTVTLANATGANLGTATASGSITNDDQPATTPPPSGGGGQGQVLSSTTYGATLTGGAGDDTINAGQGPDVLTGGGGADRFVYAAAPWNPGKVSDFLPGTDKIDLRGLFDAGGYNGTTPWGDGHMSVQQVSNGTQVLVDADGAGGEWPITVTTLIGVTPAQLSASDWIVQ